jgi:hypothetical protein
MQPPMQQCDQLCIVLPVVVQYVVLQAPFAVGP